MGLTLPKAKVHKACLNGDVKKLEKLLDRGFDVNEYDWQWKLSNPFIMSTWDTNESCINISLARSPYIPPFRDSQSLLHIAVKGAFTKVCNSLMDRTENIDRMDLFCGTSLDRTVLANSLLMIEMLIKKGVNVNFPDSSGKIPLHYAVGIGSLTIPTKLLDAGSDIDSEDINGTTPLFTAISTHSVLVVQMLLDRGAKVNFANTSGRTPLSHAISHQNEDIVKMLLNAGARIDFKNSDGWFPLEAAYQSSGKLTEKIKKIIILLKEHLFKLLTANMEVDPTMLSDRVVVSDGFEDFQQSCSLEVEAMKMKKVGGVSVYDVLVNTDNASYADNIEMECYIKSDRAKKEFPKYAALLRLQFKEGQRRDTALLRLQFKEGKQRNGYLEHCNDYDCMCNDYDCPRNCNWGSLTKWNKKETILSFK